MDSTHKSELRSSCEPCHLSKLKCSREKPVCARCKKTGMSCTYEPTKRPGRPRKAVSAPVRPDTPRRRTHTSVTSRAGKAKTPTDSARELRDRALDSSFPTDGGLSGEVKAVTPCQWDLSVPDMGNLEPDQALDMLDLDFILSRGTADPEFHTIDRLAQDVNIGLPAGMSFEQEDGQMACVSIGDGFSLPDSTALPDSSTTSTSNTERSASAPSACQWPTNLSQFTDECALLRPWATPSSSSLATLFSETSECVRAGGQCLCQAAMTNLLGHRNRARETPPDLALDACLHLQRVLQYAWTVQKGCRRCQDDELAKLMAAGIADEVVGAYRTIIDNHIKSSWHGRGREHAGTLAGALTTQPRRPGSPPETPLQLAILSFGSKTVQGPTKIAFLRRLVRLKLRQTHGMLEELVDGKQTVPNHQMALALPLGKLVSGTVDRINITAGMLSTLE